MKLKVIQGENRTDIHLSGGETPVVSVKLTDNETVSITDDTMPEPGTTISTGTLAAIEAIREYIEDEDEPSQDLDDLCRTLLIESHRDPGPRARKTARPLA